MNHYINVIIKRGFVFGLSTLGLPWSLSLNMATAATISTFEQALTQVVAYQDQQKLLTQRQQIADLNVRNNGLWKNPTLSVQQEGFSTNQEKSLSLSINQPIDLFGERKLNQSIAKVANEQSQLQLSLWKARGELIVKYQWAQMSLAHVEQQIYAAQLKVSQNNLESAQKRYQAGSIALVDFERAQIEALENQRLYQQASLNLTVASHRLSNLWGEAEATIQVNKNKMPWPEQSQDVVQAYIASGWLEKLYNLNSLQAKNQIEQVKLQSRPNPTLSVGVTRTQGQEETSGADSRSTTDSAVMLGVEIPLNILNRQQYRIPMAQQYQVLMSQQQQRELKQQILDIANALQQLKGLSAQFKSAADQLVLSEKVQQRTLQGFQAGKLSLTDVQQASLQLQSIRLGQLEVMKQAWLHALSAEALSLGSSYEQISGSDAYSQLNKTIVEQTESLMNIGVQ